MVLSLDEVKAHLRIETNDEDLELASMISKSQARAEEFCRVTFPDGDDAPETVRLAVLLMTSYLYENRDAPDHTAYVTMRTAFENLLYPHRDPALMF
ncbi:MAG: phage gp6-like head-tail connector protein [Lachnospiraceae bacterium]|nr:phage gp6-like head-tail connector protein [Lachnospiraceae bacterium]